MRSFEEVFSQIQPHLNSLEELRKKQKSKNFILLLCWLGLALLTIIIFSAGVVGLCFAFIFITIIWGIIAGVLANKQVKKYKLTFKDIVITPLIRAIDPNLNYSKEAFISRDKYMASIIFPTYPDVYKGEDYVWGMVDKTMIEFSELHTEYKTHDSKGRTEYHTIFKGLFMIADFNKDFKGRTIVLPDYTEKTFGFIAKFFQKMNYGRDQLVYMEDPVFEKEFKVYSNDQVEARYILSTDMLSRIVQLKRDLGCHIHLSFVNSKIFIAVSTTKDMFDPKINQSVLDQNMIREFYNQIYSCINIINELNLNTRIWTK